MLPEITKSGTVRRRSLVCVSTTPTCLGCTTAATSVCSVGAPHGCKVKDRPNRHRDVLGNQVRWFKTVQINFASPLLRWQEGKPWCRAELLLYFPGMKILVCRGRVLQTSPAQWKKFVEKLPCFV